MTTRLEPDLPLPPVVPDYALVRVIGRGAYGEVWLARGVTGLFRAVKIVRRSSFREDGPYEREFEGVRRFAEISLGEPSQLALLHVGRNDAAGFFYYVMELADDVARGRDIDPASYAPHTLRELRRGPPQSVAKVLEIGVALARALASLHAHGLVHRDVKPSNVIFVGGVPKLADIGLVIDADGDHSIVGTIGYIAPHGENRPEGDVYALGKVLYELVTGLDRQQWPRLPGDLARREDRKALLELNEVLVRACEPDPRKRFRDAAALLAELRLVQAGSPMRPLKRQLRRALRVSIALAAVSAVALAGAWVQFKRAEKAEAERDEVRRWAVYAATIGSAQRAKEQEDFGTSRRLLRGLEPKPGEKDLRGFEWRVLRDEAEGDPALVVREHGSPVLKLACERSRGVAAALDAAGAVTTFRLGVRDPVAHVTGVRSLAGFRPGTEEWIGLDRRDHWCRWSIDGKMLSRGGRVTEDVTALGVTAEGEPVAFIAGEHPCLHFASMEGGEGRTVPLPSEGAPGGRWDLFFNQTSPDGRVVSLVMLAGRSVSSLRKVLVLDVADGHGRFAQSYREPVLAAVVGSEGRDLWVALDGPSRIERRNLDTGRRYEDLNSDQSVFGIWPELGERGEVAAVQESGPIVLRARDDGKASGALRGAAGRVSALVAAPNGEWLVAGSSEGEIRQFRLRAERRSADEPTTLQVRGDDCRLQFSLDGHRLFAGDESGRAVVSAVPATGNMTPSEGCLLAETAAEAWMLSASERRLVRQKSSGEKTFITLQDASDFLWPLLDLPRGRLLASDSAGKVAAWSIATGARLDLAADLGSTPWLLQLSRDGDTLWAATNSKALVAVDAATLAVRTSLPLRSRVTSLWETDVPGELALGTEGGALEVIGTADGTLRQRVQTASGIIYRLVGEPRSGRLFAAGSAGTVHVFSTAPWREVARLELGSPEPVVALAVSRDGATLAALGARGRLRMWSASAATQARR